MKGWLLWLFLFLHTPVTQAQTRRITGVVLDGQTITLLPGVAIQDNTGKTVVTSDSSGSFAIMTPPSAVRLNFHLSGYRSAQKTFSPEKNFSPVFLYRKYPKESNGNMSSDSLFYRVGTQDNFNIPVTIKAHDDETYEVVKENPFENTAHDPFSSFILNANDAAYCNVRRFITAKELPPSEAVRIEEMTNYFSYHYQHDTLRSHPITFMANIITCPWHPGNLLMRIVVNAMKLPEDTLIPNNLVLLIDISGSMDRPNKLPLLKVAFDRLVEQTGDSDKISVVAYSGDVSVVLPPTPGSEKAKILDAINNLEAGGSTAGGAGIEKAFVFAKNNFIKDGNNRVILATDGDFNVGETSDEDMRKIVSKYHSWGIYLTCIGVGMGNYKDSKLETLAQWGQGNFAYIDNKDEAERLFDRDHYRKTLITMAANAQMKVIFNPDIINAYRLIGYETRAGGKSDSASGYFPGGDMNYGQSITAFYELQPQKEYTGEKISQTDDIAATLALQYKTIFDNKNHLLIRDIPEKVENFDLANDDIRFATAITLFGMLLRQSYYTDKGNYKMVEKIIRHLKDDYEKNERKACLKLIQRAEQIPPNPVN